MARQVQLRRGTTAENDNFIGAAGELTFDTTTGAVRAHDGSKQGGHMLDSVVAYKLPTSESKTWYRKYASGWVEQGGIVNATQYNTTTVNVTFPIPMADSNYYANANANTAGHQETWAINARCAAKTQTGMSVHGANNANAAYTGPCSWKVSGLAA